MKLNLIVLMFLPLHPNGTPVPVPVPSPGTDISVTMPDNETVVQLKFTVKNYQNENDTSLGVRIDIISVIFKILHFFIAS